MDGYADGVSVFASCPLVSTLEPQEEVLRRPARRVGIDCFLVGWAGRRYRFGAPCLSKKMARCVHGAVQCFRRAFIDEAGKLLHGSGHRGSLAFQDSLPPAGKLFDEGVGGVALCLRRHCGRGPLLGDPSRLGLSEPLAGSVEHPASLGCGSNKDCPVLASERVVYRL